MKTPENWLKTVFNIPEKGFEPLALQVFDFQYTNNPVYREYCQALGRGKETVHRLEDIPFLPISLFKTHAIKTGEFEPAVVFESSGTTLSVPSRHEVRDLRFYQESFSQGFQHFYGPVDHYCVIGLLPSYLERSGSSLVYMVDALITGSQHPDSGFYLHEHERLYALLKKLEGMGQATLLIGVTFGLLDFAEKFKLPLRSTTVMETGGMKGRRQEMIREQVQQELGQAFELKNIHSEYGMTELLSQAYSDGRGLFRCPPWMRVMLRDEEDPLAIKDTSFGTRESVRGAINIIDLANIYSCSFIATDDAGKLYPDGRFEVLGRLDNSDLRGCSLLVV